MCRRVSCRSCGRPSWSGCGAHVEQVLGDVPRSERCQCGARTAVAGSKRTTPKKTTATAPAAGREKRRWFRRTEKVT